MGTHRPFPHHSSNRSAPAAPDDTDDTDETGETGDREPSLIRPGWIHLGPAALTGIDDDPNGVGLGLGRAA